jgi:signal transduction histidine kinase/DNA-binding response OmpR family regulator
MTAISGWVLTVVFLSLWLLALRSKDNGEDQAKSDQQEQQQVPRFQVGLDSQADQLIRSEQLSVETTRSKLLFLESINHELRTPLNIIKGYSELLEESVREDGQDHLLSDIQKIQRASTSLLSTVNHLLELTKLDMGQVKIVNDVFQTEELISELKSLLSVHLKEKGNRIKVDTSGAPPVLKADSSRVRQILQELLMRANKATKNSEIQLQISTTLLSGQNYIRFDVIDEGKGIEEDLLSALFSSYSPDTQNSEYKAGMKLAICRRLATLMDGDLEAENNVEGGSCFRMILPQRDVLVDSNPSLGLLRDMNENYQAPKILLIEDVPYILHPLREYFESEGLDPLLARSSEEALILAVEHQPKVILIDGLISNFGAWQAIERLKSKPETAQIPVLLISMVEDITTTFSLGAIGFLGKPINESKLTGILSRYFNNSIRDPILVVEDDAVSRKMIKKIISKQDWPCQEAKNGAEALNMLDDMHPSMILLDLMMPLMGGFEFFRVLRRNPKWEHIPILFISSASITEDSRLKVVGAFELIKHNGDPFEPAFMETLTESVLRYTKHKTASEAADV